MDDRLGLIDDSLYVKSICIVQLDVELWQLEPPRYLSGIELRRSYRQLVESSFVLYGNVFTSSGLIIS